MLTFQLQQNSLPMIEASLLHLTRYYDIDIASSLRAVWRLKEKLEMPCIATSLMVKL